MWGGMAMTMAPGGKLAAPGHKPQPAAPPPGTAAAAATPQPRPAVVTLPGEIDTSNDGQVQDTLTRALGDGTAILVADAGATTYCGCSGVTALLLAHHRAAAAGAQLRVVVSSPPVRRILELTAADQVLNTYPTLAAALADGQAPDRS
jgi:anti-anti-sigma factor